jgi:uncharacterized protein (TIGR03067 family)
MVTFQIMDLTRRCRGGIMLRSIAGMLLLVAPVVAYQTTGDLKKMAGTWEAKRYLADGKMWSAKELATMKLIIKGSGENELILGKEKLFGTYKLDESASPKRIDITLTQGPDKGKKKLGIYDLKGDTLRFCVGPIGGERPKEFIGKPMPGVWMEEWQRVK